MKADFKIDYDGLMSQCCEFDLKAKIEFLSEELPYLWLDNYMQTTWHQTQALRIRENGFLYIYDCYSGLVDGGMVPANPEIEDRVLGVLGLSNPTKTPRNASRQRGWAGLIGPLLGAENDKGHFIAHSLGGGFEINMFVQRRDVNRGWSDGGKVYREMEGYCASNPGTFLFSRPVYTDDSARPHAIEFGLLREDRNLWLEVFEN